LAQATNTPVQAIDERWLTPPGKKAAPVVEEKPKAEKPKPPRRGRRGKEAPKEETEEVDDLRNVLS
ncbi:MAG: hypothetical protein K8I30_12120, partial [Anaerolineae bacterium]|nr:hypothetical protein [Anaerolineae bacterium]